MGIFMIRGGKFRAPPDLLDRIIPPKLRTLTSTTRAVVSLPSPSTVILRPALVLDRPERLLPTTRVFVSFLLIFHIFL